VCIDQKLIFSGEYSSLGPKYVFGNALGMVILVYIFLVLWILNNEAWKRKSETENLNNAATVDVAS